jgi:adenine-specific DNA methylase
MDTYSTLDSLLARISASPFSLAAVSSRAGIQHSLVIKWRKRQHEPRTSSLVALEKALDEMERESLL